MKNSKNTSDDKLNNILDYAYLHTNYYRNQFDKFFKNNCNHNLADYYDDLPILTKDILQKNSNDFISDEYDINNLVVERTSGSTGRILDIYWDKSCRIKSLLSLWNERKKYGIYPFSKACYFHTIATRTVFDTPYVTSQKVIFRDNNHTISFSKLSFNNDSLKYYYDTLIKFEPEWFMCHPSTLYLFTKFMIEENLPPLQGIKLIELTGEMLLPAQREYIKNFFNVPIVNHYGMRECNGIAYECEFGHLHILDKNVHVDIRDESNNKVDDGCEGTIFVTNLTNNAMPIIKYKTDDKAMLLNEPCKCGKSTTLVITSGRLNDLIIRDKKPPIEGSIFFYIIEYVNCFYDYVIMQFKIEQVEIDHFKVYLVINDNRYFDDICNLFIAKCNNCGITDVKWDFITLNSILPEPNGKMNFFYCKVPQHNFL